MKRIQTNQRCDIDNNSFDRRVSLFFMHQFCSEHRWINHSKLEIKYISSLLPTVLNVKEETKQKNTTKSNKLNSHNVHFECLFNILIIKNASCVNQNVNCLKDAANGIECGFNFILCRNVALKINYSNLWMLHFKFIKQIIGFRLNINDGQTLQWTQSKWCSQ